MAIKKENQRVRVMLTPQQVYQLEKICEKNGLTPTEVVSLLIDRHYQLEKSFSPPQLQKVAH